MRKQMTKTDLIHLRTPFFVSTLYSLFFGGCILKLLVKCTSEDMRLQRKRLKYIFKRNGGYSDSAMENLSQEEEKIMLLSIRVGLNRRAYDL